MSRKEESRTTPGLWPEQQDGVIYQEGEDLGIVN